MWHKLNHNVIDEDNPEDFPDFTKKAVWLCKPNCASLP
jgi:hypothetical protein